MIALLAASAWADSWCAHPLVVHEWGVHEVWVEGGSPPETEIPSWFYRGASPQPARTPVRELPADSGIRRLPVVQVFGAGEGVPFALEVGFADDRASVWWPQVDRHVPAEVARSPAALAAREALLKARSARTPSGANLPLGPDPTKQLGWDALSLGSAARVASHPAELAWVDALREVPGAMWVDAGSESDRFVFYEAATHGPPDVRLEREGGRYLVRNTGEWTVHDVVVIADGRAWVSPAVPPGATSGVQSLGRDGVVGWLRVRWTAPRPAPPAPGDDCVMLRDPAIPVDSTTDYRLYAEELDVLLDVWADALFAGDGVGSAGGRLAGGAQPPPSEGIRVVYREDPAALDARMPLAVYTDMLHFVELDRLGVVLVQGVKP